MKKTLSAGNHMLVIADQARFDPIHSAYREFTLFGEFDLAATIQYQPGL